jgi:hypothetical protein
MPWRDIKPLHDWHRHHPTARRIAREMAQFPALAALRTRRLMSDIQQRYRVGSNTASIAIRFFRGMAA